MIQKQMVTIIMLKFLKLIMSLFLKWIEFFNNVDGDFITLYLILNLKERD